MPYTVTNGDCLEVSIRMLSNAQRLLMVTHYVMSDAAGPIDGIDAITAFNTEFNDATPGRFLGDFAGCLSGAVSIDQIVYQWISSTRRARIVHTPDITGGVLTGASLPQNLACAITKRSEVAGRRGTGTVHMPGLLVSSVTDGSFNTGGLAIYDDFIPRLSEVILLPTAEKMNPVVYNRLNPPGSAIVTSAEQQRTVRTMHRRTVGVGE